MVFRTTQNVVLNNLTFKNLDKYMYKLKYPVVFRQLCVVYANEEIGVENRCIIMNFK